MGEPLKAALSSGCDMASSSRASVRANLVPNASRAAYGEPSGSDLANLTFQGHTAWDAWRNTRIAIPLSTSVRTVGRSRAQPAGVLCATGSDHLRTFTSFATRVPEPLGAGRMIIAAQAGRRGIAADEALAL